MSNLLLGLSLGFAAGVSPGPMLALVIARSMEKGFASGLRVAIAPLFSDLPIVLSAVLLATALPPRLLQALGIGGGLFLIFLGVQEIVRARRATLSHPGEKRTEDLTQAILVNLLNPHPWVFWFSVGGPLVVRAWALSPIDGSSFLVSFYALLVGSKIMLAWLVARSRNRLRSEWYRWIVQTCGVMLIVVGILLVWQA